MRAGFLTFLALAAVASAHNQVTHFHVNGVADTKCVRQATNTNPIADLTSKDMACNAVSKTTASKCEVQAGDEVAFEYRSDPNKAPSQVALKDGSIKVGVTDDSHKGPCAVYAKKVSDSATAEGAGDGWFKVRTLGKTGCVVVVRLTPPSDLSGWCQGRRVLHDAPEQRRCPAEGYYPQVPRTRRLPPPVPLPPYCPPLEPY